MVLKYMFRTLIGTMFFIIDVQFRGERDFEHDDQNCPFHNYFKYDVQTFALNNGFEHDAQHIKILKMLQI